MLEFALWWLLLCLPIPFLVAWAMPPATESQKTGLKTPFFGLAKQLQQAPGVLRQHGALRIIALLAWALLVVAAARPQWVGEPVPIKNEGRDLLLAVDISGSMEMEDMQYRGRNLPRITVVKEVVGEFVEKRTTDRLGLILFGDNAYLQAPLTFDRLTVKQLLQEAQLGFAGRKTAIGDAIALGIKRLKTRPDAARVLILLTDGENTAGEIDPRQAAELAKIAGVKIHTIGVASDQMIDRGFGFFSRAQKASADLDEGTLQFIADTTGGQYFRARDMADLSQIYDTLNEIEAIEQDEKVYRPIVSLMHWPLGAALLLSLLIALTRLPAVRKLL